MTSHDLSWVCQVPEQKEIAAQVQEQAQNFYESELERKICAIQEEKDKLVALLNLQLEPLTQYLNQLKETLDIYRQTLKFLIYDNEATLWYYPENTKNDGRFLAVKGYDFLLATDWPENIHGDYNVEPIQKHGKNTLLKEVVLIVNQNNILIIHVYPGYTNAVYTMAGKSKVYTFEKILEKIQRFIETNFDVHA